MGSGPEAGLESEAAIELIEKFNEGGFSEATTLNAVNSIMGMKFSEDEKFTTLDMNSIDLYTGEAQFIKVGASMSFIKRGSEIEVVDSTTLPFGIVDDIDIKPVKKKVKNGDIIVTISDGVIDIDKDNVGEYTWIVKLDENGNIVWQKTLGFVGMQSEGYDICATSDGGFAITSLFYNGISYKTRIFKFNNEYELQWDELFDIGVAFSIVETMDNGFMLSGAINTLNSSLNNILY